jgi:uncharacterized protein (DUF2062 family)
MARKIFSRILPSARAVRENRALRWLGPLIHHPRLWHVNRRGIALGLAIGVFMGLLIPIAQIPLSALLALALRANLPIAVVSTLITNPFTFAPLYFLAYRLGALLLGHHDDAVTEEALAVEFTGFGAWLAAWWDKLVALGRPLVVGLLVMASTMALIAYGTVMLLWRLHVRYQLWQRRRRRAR